MTVLMATGNTSNAQRFFRFWLETPSLQLLQLEMGEVPMKQPIILPYLSLLLFYFYFIIHQFYR